MAEEIRRGHKIEIRESQTPEAFAAPLPGEDAEAHTFSVQPEEKSELLIDGKPIPYLKSDQGYQIYYQSPQPTLLDAARSFVDTQREKN